MSADINASPVYMYHYAVHVLFSFLSQLKLESEFARMQLTFNESLLSNGIIAIKENC